jgi:hypothetical protein
VKSFREIEKVPFELVDGVGSTEITSTLESPVWLLPVDVFDLNVRLRRRTGAGRWIDKVLRAAEELARRTERTFLAFKR